MIIRLTSKKVSNIRTTLPSLNQNNIAISFQILNYSERKKINPDNDGTYSTYMGCLLGKYTLSLNKAPINDTLTIGEDLPCVKKCTFFILLIMMRIIITEIMMIMM